MHKDPALDLVGWFTLTPLTGPTPALIPLHNQFLSHNEAALLLAFHLSELSNSDSPSGVSAKLPLTVYETVQELEHAGGTEQAENMASAMQIDGEEAIPFRLRSAHYSIETGETEMIGINYVAKGGGNASLTSSEAPASKQSRSSSSKLSSSQKLRGRNVLNGSTGSTDDSTQQNAAQAETRDDLVLNPSEADLVASLGTRLNSVRMLASRIELIQRFLSALPPTILSDPKFADQHLQEKELFHVRSIAALLKQLFLLTPSTPTSILDVPTPASSAPATPQYTILSASLAQTNDTTLVDMLSNLTNTLQATSEMGRNFATIDSARHQARSKKGVGAGGFGGNGFGALNSGSNANLLDEGYDGDVATPFFS